MLREEHRDLYGNLSSGTYTRDKAVTSSAVASNILEYGDKIALWKCEVEVTEDFDGTSSGVTFKVECAKALSSGALSSDVDVYTQTVAKANLKVGKMFDIILPEGYKYVQVTATPDTTSSTAMTAGKVAGNVYPLFN